MARERTNADEFHLAFDDIGEHWKFVEPDGTEDFSPDVDAVVVGEFAAILEAVVLIDIVLDVFAVGIHGAEFIHSYEVAVFAHPVEFDDGGSAGYIVGYGFTKLLCYHKEAILVSIFVYHLESGSVESS